MPSQALTLPLPGPSLFLSRPLPCFAVSSWAACSSGKVAPSHVLAAMGVAPELARGAIRISTGPATTEAEVDRFLNVWQKLGKSLSNGMKRGLAA